MGSMMGNRFDQPSASPEEEVKNGRVHIIFGKGFHRRPFVVD